MAAKELCPYCKKKTIDASNEECVCQNCQNLVGVGTTDYIGHSPRDICDRFPFQTRFGSITCITYKKSEESFCMRCGLTYEKSEKLCPTLLNEIKCWYKNPERIRTLDSNLNTEIIKNIIETFLLKKFKRKKVVEILKKK